MRILALLFMLFATLQGVVRRDDIPDSVYLNFGSDPRFSCVGLIKGSIGSATGTLIDPYTVLTVAHVVKNNGAEIVFDIMDPSTRQMISIRGQIQVHEGFIYTQSDNRLVKEIHNDIALIHLYSPIYSIQPAQLDYMDKHSVFSFISAGFGKSGPGSSGPVSLDFEKRGFSNKILELLSEPWCDSCYISFFDSPDSDDCSNLEGIGTQGDSGAGTFTDSDGTLRLFGLIHLLAGKGDYNSFNLILPLAPYADWIESNRYH